jgi:hypothetical protein
LTSIYPSPCSTFVTIIVPWENKEGENTTINNKIKVLTKILLKLITSL